MEIVVTGTVACKGDMDTVIGTVRQVQNEHQQIEDCHIMVCYHTTPMMVDQMREAKAIVTDRGGILCHAAIVSREYNIPCIVGTHYATSRLLDGMAVTLDMTSGEVLKEVG